MHNEWTLPSLDQLVVDLGKGTATEFVEFALPLIIQRKDELLELLQNQNWDDSAKLAHKTLSSIRLYDTGILETSLKEVENQNIDKIAQPNFKTELQQNFEDMINQINLWLKKIVQE